MNCTRCNRLLWAALLAVVTLTSFASSAPAGSIEAWGNNSYGQTTVPAGTDYTAVAAGTYRSLALTAVPEPTPLTLLALAGLLIADS